MREWEYSMQDGYVGDVGDFGKYLLLWNICSPAESNKKLKLGVNWYKAKSDGNAGKTYQIFNRR